MSFVLVGAEQKKLIVFRVKEKGSSLGGGGDVANLQKPGARNIGRFSRKKKKRGEKVGVNPLFPERKRRVVFTER